MTKRWPPPAERLNRGDTMTASDETGGARHWLGLGLIIAVVLIGGAFLEFAVDDPGEEWFLRGFLVVGILAVASYVFFAWLAALICFSVITSLSPFKVPPLLTIFHLIVSRAGRTSKDFHTQRRIRNRNTNALLL